MTSTERTPLTTQRPPGPTYVFPGVSPRSRRRQMRQFQCCMCFLFSLILLIAVVLSLTYTLQEQQRQLGLQDDSGFTTSFDIDPMNSSQLILQLLSVDFPYLDQPAADCAIQNPSITLLEESERYGRKSLGDRELLEENLNPVPVNTPSFRHQRAVGTLPESRRYAKRGYVEQQATRYLAEKMGYQKPKDLRNNIGVGPVITLIGNGTLTFPVECKQFRRYRSANGTCNNRKHNMTWGTAMQPFRRILQPDYADGISAPRISHLPNGTLPSARKASLEVHRPSYNADPKFTVMLAVWGQFLDHDITSTALTQGADGAPIDCCTADKEHLHPECFAVILSAGDPFFDQDHITCMNFIRSSAAPTGHYGPRQQLNQATAFIDGSVVYGNTDEQQKSLRADEGGLLRMFVTPDNRTLLPISTDPNDGCNQAEMNAQGKYCFLSGDRRANENLLLTSMHLLLARHHNYLATNLQSLNPHWSDEKIFQESRKILGAQMQHITYNEFLPVLFGDELTTDAGLAPKSSSERGDLYRDDVDPSIANGFATSAFRFAHTLLPSLMLKSRNDTSEDFMLLHKMLFNPYSLWGDRGVDEALQSASFTPMARSDQFFTTELTQKLFQASTSSGKSSKCPPGLDLVSLNIQRGRDHGLPPYYEWRKHCRLPDANTWEKMSKAFSNVSLENIKTVFQDPKDVDFYCGALSEPPLEDALVGPLLACILVDQFWRIKHGDSYWYERTDGPQRFTKNQLKQIYKTSLASIMCINSDHIEEAQKLLMRSSDPVTNPIVHCSEIDEIDFTPWKSTNNFAKVAVSDVQSKIQMMAKNESVHESTENVTTTTMQVIT